MSQDFDPTMYDSQKIGEIIKPAGRGDSPAQPAESDDSSAEILLPAGRGEDEVDEGKADAGSDAADS